jgi:hypothetical protein
MRLFTPQVNQNKRFGKRSTIPGREQAPYYGTAYGTALSLLVGECGLISP